MCVTLEPADASLPEEPLKSGCSLSDRQQHRNALRFGLHWSLMYLAAPVVFVGNLNAILLNKLGYSDTIANLPAVTFRWTTGIFLVLFTWYFCQVRLLKPILAIAYAISAAAGLIVILSLLQPYSMWIVVALVVHSTLIGWFLGIAYVFEWEVLSRGVDEQRRGPALMLAFGVGPVLAVVSSIGMQLLLDGQIGPISVRIPGFPWDYALLFGASMLILAIPAISAMRYVIPSPAVEVTRDGLITGVFGGLGDFLSTRLLMFTSIAFMLVILSSTTILPNVVLYTKEALGEAPQRYAGYQFALRFAFKAVAGLVLGWILVRTSPRAGLVATTGLCLAGLIWSLLVPGTWYLLTFGLLGAGELSGAYYPNYLVACSAPSQVRRNLSYAQLLTLPATVGPIFYGMISDCYGLRLSIEVAAVLLAVTILLVQFVLPRRPSIGDSSEPARDPLSVGEKEVCLCQDT